MHGIMGQRAAFSWWDGRRGDRCQRVLLLNDGSHVLLTTQHSTKVVQDHHDGHGFRFDSDVNAFGFAVVVANRNDDWHIAAGWVAGPRQFGRWLFASISMLLKQRTVRLAASKPALPAHTRPLREYPTAHDASKVSAAEQRAHRTAPTMRTDRIGIRECGIDWDTGHVRIRPTTTPVTARARKSVLVDIKSELKEFANASRARGSGGLVEAQLLRGLSQ